MSFPFNIPLSSPSCLHSLSSSSPLSSLFPSSAHLASSSFPHPVPLPSASGAHPASPSFIHSPFRLTINSPSDLHSLSPSAYLTSMSLPQPLHYPQSLSSTTPFFSSPLPSVSLPLQSLPSTFLLQPLQSSTSSPNTPFFTPFLLQHSFLYSLPPSTPSASLPRHPPSS